MTSHADVVAPRISPTRTLAISIALVLHAGAFALLVAPVRAPDRDAEVMPPKIEVAMLERVIPPPPPPPVVPITPPRPTPVPVQRVAPPVVLPNPEPAQTAADVVPEIVPPNDALPFDGAGADSGPFVPEQIGALSYLDAPPPRYPSRAITRHMEGDVLLRVTVGNDGRPEAIEVQQSSGHAVLDRAAVDQVRKRWRFRPLIVNGLPSRAIGLVPIRFSLDRH
ncbi:MAG TPA: energy transducer TonB [Pseudomonadota bacterium]|nr:energy transducer TonB [Pseudomonadota bacterium]